MSNGPLKGLRVLEFGGIGPAPMCAMLLADLGASVLRVDRAGTVVPREQGTEFFARGRRARVQLDLKDKNVVDGLLDVVERADVVIEGFRPGVMERLGLGPDICLARNPGLVYGRMTGWGQQGPLAPRAGHDINYIALTGALHSIGRAGQPPTPPLNLVGDFGGGSLYLAFGILAAVYERKESGHGQVVDAAMVDGASSLMTAMFAMLASGRATSERGTNLLDSGSPYYDVYATKDHLWMAVGAIEPQFYALLIEGLGLRAEDLPAQTDKARWPQLRAHFASRFATRTRDEWTKTFDGIDACVTPVLDCGEAMADSHLKDRGTFVEVGGYLQPGPAPRFSRSVPPDPATPFAAEGTLDTLRGAWRD